jgi:hypothetical protein
MLVDGRVSFRLMGNLRVKVLDFLGLVLGVLAYV